LDPDEEGSFLKVLINAVSIQEGGSKVVLSRLLAAMRKARPDVQWLVAAHPKFGAPENADATLQWISAPDLEHSVFGVLNWYERTLPALIRIHQPDVLFSQTNYLPRSGLDCPSLLLIQHAGHFSPEFDRLMLSMQNSRLARFLWRQKRRWVHRSAKTATVLTVQTAALADAISAQIGLPREAIAVIPHGPGVAEHRSPTEPMTKPTTCRIGYITKWGVQKNFRTLFEAARILTSEGRRLTIVLTLDETMPQTRGVMATARSLGVEAFIENHGEVDQDRIVSLYDTLDIFVFPSLCESFGFPMVEAMARGLPIVVAATAENLEVTAGAALSYSPRDSKALSRHLARLIDSEAERTCHASLSLETSRRYSWEKAARQTIDALEQVQSLASNKYDRSRRAK
jgi:glycosyltransferase involved in cell wall biosynthesis